jgi:hypothetical protein
MSQDLLKIAYDLGAQAALEELEKLGASNLSPGFLRKLYAQFGGNTVGVTSKLESALNSPRIFDLAKRRGGLVDDFGRGVSINPNSSLGEAVSNLENRIRSSRFQLENTKRLGRDAMGRKSLVNALSDDEIAGLNKTLESLSAQRMGRAPLESLKNVTLSNTLGNGIPLHSKGYSYASDFRGLEPILRG